MSSMRKIGEYRGLHEDTGRYDDYDDYDSESLEPAERRGRDLRPVPVSDLSERRPRQAPAGVVAVPITVAPAMPRSSAIAAPMPRDAPVTSATFPETENRSNTAPIMLSSC